MLKSDDLQADDEAYKAKVCSSISRPSPSRVPPAVRPPVTTPMATCSFCSKPEARVRGRTLDDRGARSTGDR